MKEKDGQTFDAFTDPEIRYRQRYVDLIVNPHVREVFIKRSKIISTMREYFNQFGYVEVETPILLAYSGRCGGTSVHYPPQRARHRPIPAHRQRAVPQEADRRRLRRRV